MTRVESRVETAEMRVELRRVKRGGRGQDGGSRQTNDEGRDGRNQEGGVEAGKVEAGEMRRVESR
jgi:hypothetical protein